MQGHMTIMEMMVLKCINQYLAYGVDFYRFLFLISLTHDSSANLV